eukprot:CAMPEP_0202906224 /NCGR_PEP_ID=MMETSP1392-20130828/37850_1 /ASSEMBLY_ACC=CAM_ASM_000868 /TAXON_ID=225041 /ORGANISM="Chlamydomonas chlamydogama, Strain SAG 11-48b" /LENGTH=76 /DNA_ID=CAMNT_0049594621 /DNA_START=722 /DNA_END=948 /DNA_ORIENTATION=+
MLPTHEEFAAELRKAYPTSKSDLNNNPKIAALLAESSRPVIASAPVLVPAAPVLSSLSTRPTSSSPIAHAGPFGAP